VTRSAGLFFLPVTSAKHLAFDFETRLERQPEAGQGFQIKSNLAAFSNSGAEDAETP
jgi:hypothetical protein